MDSIITWIENNFQWLFSGAGIVVLGWLISWMFKRKKVDNSHATIAPVIQQKQAVIIKMGADPRKVAKLSTNQATDIKAKTHILFVDDEDFTVVKLLKNAGWSNTKLKRRISNVDDPAIIDAHIIFVDIVGVCGDLFKDEGLGLARALKEKYPDKKIIIYSGETQGDRFDRTLRMVDECLPKNAEFYQFLSLVDQFANEIWKKD